MRHIVALLIKTVMHLSENLQSLRKRWKESQDDFGRRFGFGRGAVGKWEAGESEPPLAAMVEMERLSGVSILRLVTQELRADDFAPAPGGAAVMREPEAPYKKKEELTEVAALRAALAEMEKKMTMLERKIELMDTEMLRLSGRKK
jgi:transcriptional regulator with XRE-family HTH domain